MRPELVEVRTQALDTGWVHTVDPSRARGVIDHQMSLLEHAQVLGNGRARNRKRASELTDGLRTRQELLEDGAAGGIAERLERPRAGGWVRWQSR